MTPKPEQFIVDKQGRTKSVLLSLAEYRKIVKHLYDLEDALDLKRAVASGRGTLSHLSLMGKLKNLGIV